MPKRARWASMLAASLLLSACGPGKDKFPEKAWEATCEWMVECYGYYDDADECIGLFDDYEDYFTDYYESCDYDRGAAGDCLKLYEDIGCSPSQEDVNELSDTCEDVWDC